MSGWNPVEWDIPMGVKVPLIALAVCAGIALVIGGFGLLINLLYLNFGENVAVATVLGSLGFAIVCLFTWIALD